VIGIEISNGQVIITLPKAVLEMTKQQFIEALRRVKAWRRRQALAQRLTRPGAGGPITATDVQGRQCERSP
jgi:hypothetical protein